MGKQKIKKGEVWIHTPSGGQYQVIDKSMIKIPHVGWFKSVVYQSINGKMYSRFIEDFENKFTRTKQKAFIDKIEPMESGRDSPDNYKSNI